MDTQHEISAHEEITPLTVTNNVLATIEHASNELSLLITLIDPKNKLLHAYIQTAQADLACAKGSLDFVKNELAR